MSPEPLAADRTYLGLKRDIVTGKHALGASFNLQRLADEFGTSITPVRDAIHRLVGEQLVAVLPGGGFHLPIPSIEELRELYAWHEQLVRQALPTSFAPPDFAALDGRGGDDTPSGLARSTTQFFELVAAAAGNREIMRAVANASERLAHARLREPALIKSIGPELDQMVDLAVSGRTAALRVAIREYHRRRLRRVERIALALRA